MDLRTLPTGTVTFLFSDVEGSTGLLQRLAAGYRDVIERHARIIRGALATHHGFEVSTEGDSFFAVFTSAGDAVAAAAEIQQALTAADWPEGGTVAVRIGLYTGTGELGHDNYVGLDVNRAARISAAGHGGQVVVSESVRALTSEGDYADLGEHMLKGLNRTERLYQLHIPGLPETFPPLRTISNRPNNLPTLAATIVGREREVSQLKELLAENRLVTITGPGGIGTTRLALELAGEVLTTFEKGAFLVDLAPVDDAQLVLPEIAATIGFDEADERGLAAALQDGPRLLVLDNFEQVVTSAATLGTLMAEAAPMKAVVTSQMPLRISSEHVFRLDPLPASGDESPAVSLFEARALQADPSFALDAHRADVGRLVEALEGVPLAIELAAARVNVLTPAQVLERLQAGLSVLRTKRSDASERHRSLEAALAWSYELLDDTQQELLRVMSVFRGGASLAALESLAGPDAVDDLAELVDRSLVRTDVATVGKRFYLLAPVHAFVTALDEDPPSLADRHAAFFAELAANAHDPLERDSRARWLAVLNDEHDNLRAALDHLLDRNDVQGGYVMLYSIWRYFQSSGQPHELGLWLDRYFAADDPGAPTSDRARALLARAALFYWSGRWAEAIADYREAVFIAEEAEGEKRLLGESLIGLAGALGNAAAEGDHSQLGEMMEAGARAYQVVTELGDKMAVANLEFGMEIMRSMAGGPSQPDRSTMHRIMKLHEEAGSLMNVAQGYITLAQMDCTAGQFEEARRNTLTAFEKAEQAGDTFTIGWALRWVAIAIVELGDPALGAKLSGAASAAEERSGGKFPDYPWFDGRAEVMARDRIGAAADEAFAAGSELGLLEAVGLARAFVPAS